MTQNLKTLPAVSPLKTKNASNYVKTVYHLTLSLSNAVLFHKQCANVFVLF